MAIRRRSPSYEPAKRSSISGQAAGSTFCFPHVASDRQAKRTAFLKEAFRVLKPGDRFAVSDVVVRGTVPDVIKKNMELWIGCVAGALSDYEYVAKLAKAGFDNIGIEETRVYRVDDARTFLASEGLDADALAKQVDSWRQFSEEALRDERLHVAPPMHPRDVSLDAKTAKKKVGGRYWTRTSDPRS